MSNLIRLTQKRNKHWGHIFLGVVEQDNHLSWKAKGIHTYLITRPPDWQLNYQDLYNRATDGKASVQSGIDELKQYGYLKIISHRDEQNKITSWEWVVTEDPKTLPITHAATPLKNSHPESQNVKGPDPDFPDLENLDSGKPATNNKHSNKKLYNNPPKPPQGGKELEANFSVEKRNRWRWRDIPPEQQHGIQEVMGHLNQVSGFYFDPQSRETAQHVYARLLDGMDLETMKLVIDHRASRVKGTDFEDLLNPGHLFREKNFHNHLAAAHNAQQRQGVVVDASEDQEHAHLYA